MSNTRTLWLSIALIFFGFGFDAFADREQTPTDCTITLARQPFGLLGYSGGSYLCYGRGRVWIPLRLETLTTISVAASLLISGVSVFLFRGRRC